ncbi:hypothetical protein [Halobaculum gomorrense]|uniref:Uncharacterized protein n=1 Tax=Halobaculum gomorrense TaxID=43928 RepID=A0A1M5JIQ6_9EURY|nr:hypothetical protein [Halobaculum gomorrense]SHG40285.1 hypothetical protein SAMN05443636_0120 [Halobaculum gomorrense]
MALECAIWRACTGGDAVVRGSDASPPRSFRNRPICRACLDALDADPTVDLEIAERFSTQAA